MFQNIMENWQEYMGAFAAFILVFDRLAKLTPNKTDNKIVDAMRKVFSALSVRVKDK